MNQFQKVLLDLMNEKDVNRVQLSKELKISASALDGYFNKDNYPTLNIAVKLAIYFECSIQYLLGLTDNIDNVPTTQYRTFFEVFCNLLETKNLDKSKLFNDLKMSRTNYYRWQKGLIPKTQNLIELSKYFDVTVDYLVGRSDSY